jgi:eukaryotic-like serine/threonine-protein kinase
VNSVPRRNLPWGTALTANVNVRIVEKDRGLVHDVGTHPDDMSPYGVLDLAGSVTEWTDTPVIGTTGARVIRGGNFKEIIGLLDLADSVAIENVRAESWADFGLGVRCVSDVE